MVKRPGVSSSWLSSQCFSWLSSRTRSPGILTSSKNYFQQNCFLFLAFPCFLFLAPSPISSVRSACVGWKLQGHVFEGSGAGGPRFHPALSDSQKTTPSSGVFTHPHSETCLNLGQCIQDRLIRMIPLSARLSRPPRGRLHPPCDKSWVRRDPAPRSAGELDCSRPFPDSIRQWFDNIGTSLSSISDIVFVVRQSCSRLSH